MTQILFSIRPHDELGAQLKALSALPPLPPFSTELRAFANDFSKRVLALPQLRQHPELATLAHWFRAAAVDHLATRLDSDDAYRAARGLVFHVAPANVDVLFAYAWLLSMLCGNLNVARLSQKPSIQREALISILDAFRRERAHPEALERTVLLTYPHDDRITEQISRAAHARIVWGGDATVANIRSIPMAPLAMELSFPDRFGVAAFRAAAIAELNDDQLSDLARRFCNDLLWFGQQACSSPRCLYWVGTDHEIATAKSRFWPAVREQAVRFADEPAALMGRVTDAYLLAATGRDTDVVDGLSAYPLRLNARHANGGLREMQSGHGLVVEINVEQVEEIALQLDDRDQTLVQLGFNPAEIRAFLGTLPNRAIDWVVPVGRALDFDRIWDGTDLFSVLSRQIVLS